MKTVNKLNIVLAILAVAVFSCKKEKEKEKEVTLESIAVTTQPTKKEYVVGDEFDPAGMIVTATYSDNTKEPVTITTDMLSYDFGTAGANKTVIVTYEGKTATVTGITVVPEEVTLVSIAVTTQPTKKEYVIGDEFDPAGMVVTATYSDETTIPVAYTELNFDYDFSTASTNKTVTITYEGNIVAVSEIIVVIFYGSGTSDAPYQIGNPVQLAKLSELMNNNPDWANKYYKLTSNIDLSNYNATNTDFNSGKGWIPIGKTTENPFSGNFDGVNHIISSLFINENGNSYVGLFGSVNGGTIKNLGVEIAAGGITCNGLVGDTRVGIVGGVAGSITNGSIIINCYVKGNVSGGYTVGGVAGGATYGSSIINCYVIGNVNCIWDRVSDGGLGSGSGVGGVAATVRNNSIIINCYVVGNVSGNDEVGGIAGMVGSNSSVENCYTMCAISGSNGVGGVVGYVPNSGIINCAALNTNITRTNGTFPAFGCVAGYSFSSTLTGNIAWIGVTSNVTLQISDGRGGTDIIAAQAKTQATYTNMGWQFGTDDDNPWKWGDDSYPLPILYWQTSLPELSTDFN